MAACFIGTLIKKAADDMHIVFVFPNAQSGKSLGNMEKN
jgi:hypothetical protein